jgi:lipoate-protein ligase A
MFDALHVYDDLEPRRGALNMAVDEALLENALFPTIRFYRWEVPALSFGYFGSFAEVANQRNQREIVRRWTGGGVVPHGEDLTYSVIVPASHPFFAHSSLAIYSGLHDAIRQTLNANGVEATLANAVAPKISEHCFSNAVRADVISDGRKIAGAAHRRSRAGLLHQGSIQHSDLPKHFIRDFSKALCPEPEDKSLGPALLARAAIIAQSKYGTDDWLLRR